MAIDFPPKLSSLEPPVKRLSAPESSPLSHAMRLLHAVQGSRIAKVPPLLKRRGGLLGGAPRRKFSDGSECLDDEPSGIPDYDLDSLELASFVKSKHVTLQSRGHEGWSRAEVDLFNRLNDRGAVPVAPASWQLDFPTLPDSLFSATKSRLLMRPMSSNFRGIKAFDALVRVGTRVRDRLDAGLDPSRLLERALRAYVQFALDDAGLWRCDFLPTVFVARVRPSADPQRAVAGVEREMRRVSDAYRRLWGLDGGLSGESLRASASPPPPAHGPLGLRGGSSALSKIKEVVWSPRKPYAEPYPSSLLTHATPSTTTGRGNSAIFSTPVRPPSTPGSTPGTPRSRGRPSRTPSRKQARFAPLVRLPTLYALVVAKSVVELCTFEPGAGATPADGDGGSARPSRHIATFFWNEDGQDVWNAFAVAIAVLQARDWLVQFQRSMGGLPNREEEEEDYDA